MSVLISRRSALVGLSAVSLPAGASTAPANSPFRDAMAKYNAAKDAFNEGGTFGTITDEALDALTDRFHDAGLALARAPVQNTAEALELLSVARDRFCKDAALYDPADLGDPASETSEDLLDFALFERAFQSLMRIRTERGNA